jgi:hypothetical protein
VSCGMHGMTRNEYKLLVLKPERCEDNIRMDIKDTWWYIVHRIHLVQSRDQWRAPVNRVMDLGVP